MIDVERTIISQYGNSATISQLIQNMNECIDPRTNFDDFYDFVWNVETAQGFGLDIWGRIVNIDRDITIPGTAPYFGFEQALPGVFPFNEAPFYNGIPPATSTYSLSDDAYRRLILVKALSNISASNARSINTLLTNLFINRGRAYALDLGGMAMRYVFEFALEPFEIAIITNSGAIMRPAGVLVHAIIVPDPTLGFEEAGPPLTPFDEGTFIPEAIFYAIE